MCYYVPVRRHGEIGRHKGLKIFRAAGSHRLENPLVIQHFLKISM